MATLGNIRKHGVLLIAIVGIAMLAFIVGDFLSSSTSFFRGQQTVVGVIEGEKVDYATYEERINQLTEVYKIETGRADLDDDMHDQLRAQVWQMLVTDITLSKQAEEVGLRITDKELYDLCCGENVHQIIRGRRAFYDQTGNFNRMALIQFINSLEREPENEEQAANLNQAKKYWLYWENAVRVTRLQEKYTALFGKLVGANSLDAKYAFEAGLSSVNVEYVMKPYYAVADDAVEVKNSDLKALYKKNKEMYKQEPNRGVKYIVFDLKPSAQDDEEVRTKMERLADEFYTTEDVAELVNANSDIVYTGMDYSENTVPAEYKAFAFGKNAKAGDHTSLELINGFYTMARIVKCGYSVPDSVKVKFIATEEGQEDQELGWFTAADVNKDFAEKAFACKKGERFVMPAGAESQTFEVIDLTKATPKVKLAIMAREVIVSDRTKGLIYNEAMQYIIDNPTAEDFVANAGDYEVHSCNGLEAITAKVDGMKGSREIVRWAFEAKEGDVAQEAYECGEQYVIAALTEVNDGEYRSFESVAPILRYEALNNKKAELIMAELAGVSTLEEAAEKMDAQIQVAEGVSLAAYRFGNAGNEPAVIGKAMQLAAGQVSAPIQGVSGVFVVKGGEKETAEAEFDAKAQIMQLNMRTSYSLPYQAVSLIEEKAEIEDNRAKFQ